MKKRNLPLIVIMIVIFFGGFSAGIVVSSQSGKGKFIERTENALPSSIKEIGLKETPIVEKNGEKVMLAYVQDFRDPNKLDSESYTHVIFSFAHPTKTGDLLFNGEHALENLRAIVKKAQKTKTKVLLAVGGWYHVNGGESYPYFKEAISNQSSRTKLVQELDRVLTEEDLDGIDIDFEHPRSMEDAQILTVFIKELKSILEKKDKELSIAVNAKVHSTAGTEINNVIYDPSMFQYTDHVNIMAYDGQWDGDYDAANLSAYSYNVNIVNYWTNLFDSYGLPREKLVLGIPSYGQPEDPSKKQVSYAAIINENPQNAYQDTVSMKGITYHYNGIASVQKKTQLALINGLGGMMIWEAGLDAEGTNSLTRVLSEELKIRKEVGKVM